MKTRRFAQVLSVALSLTFGSTAVSADGFIDPVLGSDVTGDGTKAAPWKTITHALTQSEIDLWLAPGDYDAASGEVFPLTPGYAAIHSAVVGLASIRTGGQSAFSLWSGAYLVLEGVNLEGSAPGDPPAGVGIDGWNSTIVVSDCTIAGFETGIDGVATNPGPGLGSSAVALSRTLLRHNGVAVVIRAYIYGSPFEPGWGVSWGTIQGNLFIGNDTGVVIGSDCIGFCVEARAGALISGNTIVNQTTDGVRLESIVDPLQAQIDAMVSLNIFANNGGYGIDDSATAAISLNDFWNNGLGDWRDGTGATPDNLFLDPVFVDPSTDDYRLQATSPCIDALVGGVAGLEFDLDGRARPLDGDGDLIDEIDIGAYEFVTPSGLSLRRGQFAALSPPPDKAALYPFDGSNPRTPEIVADWRSGDADSTPGILSGATAPLAFYQVEPDPGASIVLYAVKDTTRDAVVFYTP